VLLTSQLEACAQIKIYAPNLGAPHCEGMYCAEDRCEKAIEAWSSIPRLLSWWFNQAFALKYQLDIVKCGCDVVFRKANLAEPFNV
jgi:hypothetical protein